MNECETDLKTDTENALKKAINKITILEAKNELLEAQIEKMKCFKNCQTWNEWQCPCARNELKDYVEPLNCPCVKWELRR